MQPVVLKYIFIISVREHREMLKNTTVSVKNKMITTQTINNMKRGILYLLFIVMFLQVDGAHAQGELWGTDYVGKAIFKFDGNNPGPANFVKKLDLRTAGAPDPRAGLTLYSNGKLYGTTQAGGSSNLGVLFEYDPATAIFTKKVDFVGINGKSGAALTLAANGKLYGTTSWGGVSDYGVLFEYDPVTNTYTKKVDFDGTLKGSYPGTTLTPAPNGKLYGMTGSGGAFNLGVLFEYDPATSTYTKRVDFSGTSNGAGPRSGPLAVGGNGKLYGVTYSGGASDGGVLFEFDPSTNVFTKKVDFINGGVAGSRPVGGLVLAGNGKLYGTASYGDPSSLGVLFEYDYVTNSYAVKHDFLYDDAGQEVDGGLTLAGNGKLYGITIIGGGLGDNGTGALFEYDPTSNTFTTKMQFNHYSNPDHPFSVHGSLLYAQTQTITGFAAIPNKTYGDAPFTVSAIGGASGKPVTFISSDQTIATVSGNTVAITGIGTVTITAHQAGTTAYLATATSQTFTVSLGPPKTVQSITFNSLADKVVGDAAFSLTGTATSGLPVTYTSSNTAVATVSGSTVTIVGAGATFITASQEGNATFYAAVPVTQALTVTKTNQTITFSALADQNIGDANFNLAATASSGLPVNYTSSNPSVATISGSTVTIAGPGITIITASQAGNASYNAAAPASQTLTVNKTNQTITFNALADKNIGDANFNLTATASSSLAVSYSSGNTSVATVSGNTVTIVGVGTTIITASQSGNSSYNAATPVTQTLTVNKSNQTITFNALADKNVGDANFNLTATASSSLAVSYTSSNTSVATVSGNIVTIVGGGTTIITSSQAGNTTYSAAPDVPQSLTVNKGNQTITFDALSSKTFGDTPFTLTGTASSGLVVSYVSSNTSVAMVSGSTLIIVGAGSTTITASQAGNASYNAATSVPQTLTVNKANQVITFSPLPDKAVGDAPFNLTATASSGLPVTYLNGNSAVATLSGNTVTIVGVGTTAFLARQSGNSNYNAATPLSQGLTVKRLTQSITFNPLPPKNVGDEPFELTATASSGLPVSYISSNTSVATISGSTLTIVGGGSATINAMQGGDDIYNSATVVALPLIVNKLHQAISFVDLPAKTVDDAPFSLTATASSGLPVTYTSNNPSVATVSGNTATIVGAGTATITATQAGNASYNLATPASRLLTVNKLNQTITFSNLASKTVGDAAFNLTATTDSGLPLSFTSSNPSVATISGSTVTIVGGGSTIITALQSGNATYNVAITVTQMLTVNKSSQTITFPALADKEIGGADFNLTASASSSLAVSYESSNPSVATVTGSTITIVGAGTTNITASQVGNSSYNAAIPVTQTLTVNKSNQTIMFSALADKNVGDANFNLTATASSSLAVSYASSNTSVATVSGNTVTIVGAGTTIITATQAGNANYNAATPVSRTLTVNKSNQTITFAPLADKNVGDANFNLTATASSSLAVSYASSNTSVATVSGNTVAIVGGGTTIITASQSGNASFNAATSVTQTLTVNKGSQTITFNTLADKIVGDAAFSLSATASSGLAITYSSGNTSVATVSGNTVTIVGTGTTIITASQSGNASFNPAPSATQTLTVNKANQTITFNTLADKTVGDAAFNLSATASSGLTVSYASSNTTVATISGNMVTIIGAGTAIITASQPGNGSYNAATAITQTLTVNKSNQTIAFNVLANKVIGDPDFTLTGAASSGLVVSYISSNTSVADVSGSTITIVGPGTTVITASQPGNASFYAAATVSQPLTVTAGSREDQTISFATLPDKIPGDASFNLTATTSSGLPVSYASSNESVATISDNTVTIVGAGITIITASQPGNASYNAAIDVPRILTVNKTSQTVTFHALVNKTFGDPAFTLTATASSGLPVSYMSSNPSVAVISGNTVTILGAGTSVITAFQSGNSNYDTSDEVSHTLTVSKKDQTITFTSLADKTVGNANFSLAAATTSSGLPVTYTSSNPSVATVSGNLVTIIGAGTTVITASQSGNANFNTAMDVQQILTVNPAKANQTIAFNTLADKTIGDVAFDLTAIASSGLPVTYTSSNPSVATISGSTVTIVGVGTTIITASQSGNLSYNAGTPVAQALRIKKQSQTIAFDVLANRAPGDSPFELSATSNSGLTVSYASSNPSVATISGSIVTILGAGTTIITASQPGDASYDAATDVARALTVTSTKADQTIMFNPLSEKIFGDAAFNLTATATSGLAVIYGSSNQSVATISGSTVTITGVGTTMITASQSGNGTYNAAVAISRTLTVNKKDQTISFSSLADKTVGDAAFNLTATASSGLSVSYSSTSDKVVLSGVNVNVVKPGRTTIIASQPGNAGYKEAIPASRSFCIRPAKPAIIVSNADTESPILTSSALEGNQWFLNDVTIEGATNSTFHATQPGVYKVQVKVDDCVSDFSADQPLIVTGNVENYDDNMKVEVYPNPASDWLYVSLGNLQGKKEITVFHMNGGEKASQEVDGNEARFPVADYSKGIYVVKVNSGNKVRMVRFAVH
jgi:uncharacterized repeat protein (TIGR03803 family)